MAGKKHRQRRLHKPSRSWNILFYIELIDAVQERAEELSMTPSDVVRIAVASFLEDSPEKNQGTDFMAGVRAETEMVREEIRAPVFPSGQTLGDRLAERILDKFESQKKETTIADY